MYILIAVVKVFKKYSTEFTVVSFKDRALLNFWPPHKVIKYVLKLLFSAQNCQNKQINLSCSLEFISATQISKLRMCENLISNN